MPEVPKIRFTAFSRKPRWMQKFGNGTATAEEDDLDEEALFDDLLNSDFDDLLDDEDQTDWLE